MKCCYSSPHECEMCERQFSCGGSGGVSGEKWSSSGMMVCPDCMEFAPRRSICWTCYATFSTSGELFKHLRENESHMIDKPKYCSKCGEAFIDRNIYGEVTGFFGRDRIRDHLSICDPERSWSFSEKDTNDLKKYLSEEDVKEYERLIDSLKRKWFMK